MSGRPGTFHRKHGQNIRLYENETVAHRVDSYNKAVVFTEQPIPLGAMFQVKLLDKGGGWAGSIVSYRTSGFIVIKHSKWGVWPQISIRCRSGKRMSAL